MIASASILDSFNTGDAGETVLDVVVIGAGITGIYQLHKLKEAGLATKIVEAGSGVGGTWFWNRYPGARFDSESYSYAYFFSKEILDEWDWSEHFAGQEETERYLNHVVDRLDLRGDILLNVRIERAEWDESTRTWTIFDGQGGSLRSRFVLTALGILSAPQYPPVPGIDSFTRESYHTGLWPHDEVDFSGKRVAVIGTGASGVQLIQTIAPEVGTLTVFQRTPNWCTPLRNSRISEEEAIKIRESLDDIYQSTQNQTGFVHAAQPTAAFDHDPEQRRKIYEQLFETRGLAKLYGNFTEVVTNAEINAEFSEFVASKIAPRIEKQELITKLIPQDHGYGIKRPPMETNYYEVYNQDNVSLIDLLETPIEEVTPTGIRTADGREHEFDIIVYATGFDAVTGAFDRIEIVGEAGQTLKETWADGPRTYLGMQTTGFPNLIFVGGPQSVSGNFPRSTERQIEFAVDLVLRTFEHEVGTVSAKARFQDKWVAEVQRAVNLTLLAVHKKHWSFGGNTPGKTLVHRNYAGGMLTYARFCDEEVAADFPGFEFA